MNILTTYTLKYLRLNKKRTAVTILGVILSSALICGVFLLGVSFQKVMIEHEIFMSGNWHAQFHAVPYAKANYITENSAVQTAMLSASLGSATYGSHNTVRPYLYVTAYDALSFQNQSIKLLSGRFPQKEDELLISPVMIKDSGLSLKPGSTLHLTFGKRNIPNYDEMVKAWGGEEYVALQDGETFTPSVSKTYTVVGVMTPRFDETSMPEAFPVLTYLDPAQLAAADNVDIAILARDPRSINTSALEIAKGAGLTVIFGPDGQPAKESISYNERLLPWMGASGRSNYVRSFLVIIATLIALIVCGSVLLIYNAFAISIGERKKQFGMFASVGATSAQIRRIVLTEAGVIAAIGIPLGILGAIAGVGILVKLTQGIVSQLILDAEQGLPLVVSPLVIGLTVLFSAATILLSAWIPARRASRVSPIDAIRLSGEIQEGKPLKLKTNPLIRRVFGFEGELALKSLKRDRKRYLTTLLSLMISIILFVAFNALMLYTDTTQRMAVKAMNYDLQIDLDYRQSHAKQFADLVSQLPEVQRVSYDRCAHEEYVPPRTVITDPAYQALQELNSLEFENLPHPVEGGTYQFVLKVCAVGPAEFAHYAAQLGLDVKQYSDPSAPLGILLNHTSLRQGGKLYDLDLLNLKPGDTMTVSKMSGYTSPQTGGEATPSLTWTVGAVTQEHPLGFMGTTLVPELIVSDAVFDGLSDRMQQLVTDTAGVNDQAFNQLTWKGIQKAAKDMGFQAKFIESRQPTDYEKNIEALAAEGYNVIITVGSLMGDATAVKAKQYPNMKFAIVDNSYVPTQGSQVCDGTVQDCYADGGLTNVTSLMFAEDQVGFLAGVLAAGMSRSGFVCSVSSVKTPQSERYVTSFFGGAVWQAGTNMKMMNNYINIKTTNENVPSFDDSTQGKETALRLIGQGCDVVFGVGGNTVNGALLAARENNLPAIGADVDQYNTYPEVKDALISSAQKNVDVAVYNYLKTVADGSVKAGISTATLQNGGVGLAPFHDWDSKIPADLKAQIQKASDGIKDGSIKIDLPSVK